MATSGRCQSCGAVAPTRYVDFKQNIGMLVMRRHATVAGELCKPCVHRHFWRMTGTTLAVGWLGRISMFIAPVYVVNNIARYLAVLGMPGPGGKGSTAGPPTAARSAQSAAPPRSSPPPLPAAAGPIPFDDEPAAVVAEEPLAVEMLPDPAEVLRPHWPGMVARIKAKEPLSAVAADVAGQTGLTAAEVSDYVRDRVRRANAAKAARAAAAPTTARV